jgi:hypothetical protein
MAPRARAGYDIAMERALLGLAEAAALFGPAFVAVSFVGFTYFMITLDRARANSPSKDDNQVGLKLVLYGIALAGVWLAIGGASDLLAFILGGFKGGTVPVRHAMPPVLVGGAVVAIVWKQLLPRTNAAVARQPERYVLGAIGLVYGTRAVIGFSGVVTGLFNEWSWSPGGESLFATSPFFAELIASGAAAYFAITRLGAASGWVMHAGAPPAYPPPPQYPPR